MVVLGVILLVVGLLVGIHLLFVLGLVLLVIGLILGLVGYAGHPVGGRPHWF